MLELLHHHHAATAAAPPAASGWTPLHCASAFGHAGCVALLLRQGVPAPASSLRVLIALAERGEHRAVAALLRAHAAHSSRSPTPDEDHTAYSSRLFSRARSPVSRAADAVSLSPMHSRARSPFSRAADAVSLSPMQSVALRALRRDVVGTPASRAAGLPLLGSRHRELPVQLLPPPAPAFDYDDSPSPPGVSPRARRLYSHSSHSSGYCSTVSLPALAVRDTTWSAGGEQGRIKSPPLSPTALLSDHCA